MRLREILNIIDTNYTGLNKLTVRETPNREYKIIDNYNIFKESIENLGEIEVFKTKVLNIISGEFEGMECPRQTRQSIIK